MADIKKGKTPAEFASASAFHAEISPPSDTAIADFLMGGVSAVTWLITIGGSNYDIVLLLFSGYC
jgi:hypothetical protein